MKPHVILLSILSTALIEHAAAQAFNSGSTGSYGPMNITSNTTLNLPTNGIFNCTTINVESGVTLRFNRNALNTPVYLLATDDVTISGVIDVSGGNASGRLGGKGGPGGFDGGDGGYGGSGLGGTGLGADGQGPGAARRALNSGAGSSAAFGTEGAGGTNVYGNSLLVPLIGGSGGGGADGNPGAGGGGGGGAIAIASNTRIQISGTIYARGGGRESGTCCLPVGAGSGGAIRLVAPVVTGSGNLDVLYGSASWFGGYGRVRVDCLNANLAKFLHAENSVPSRGAQMFVFPAVQPRLDIVEAAGQTIPSPASDGVSVVLPPGASTNQTVKIQARDFTNNVTITIAVIPSDRPGSNYLATITITNNPSLITVPVTLAFDSTNRIMVWSR